MVERAMLRVQVHQLPRNLLLTSQRLLFIPAVTESRLFGQRQWAVPCSPRQFAVIHSDGSASVFFVSDPIDVATRLAAATGRRGLLPTAAMSYRIEQAAQQGRGRLRRLAPWFAASGSRRTPSPTVGFDPRPIGAALGLPWHLRKTRRSLCVTVDDSGAVTVTPCTSPPPPASSKDASPLAFVPWTRPSARSCSSGAGRRRSSGWRCRPTCVTTFAPRLRRRPTAGARSRCACGSAVPSGRRRCCRAMVVTCYR